MHVLCVTVVLLAFFSTGRALRNITINAESDLTKENNVFKSKEESKYLVFDNVIVESIAENSFNEYTNLQLLYFHKNGITNLPGNLFKFNTEIIFLTVTDNLMTTLHPNTFAALKKLLVLELTDNRLESIDEMLFANNEKLTTLGFHSNNITAIHPRTFEGLVSLKTLYLSNNRLSSLPDNVFANNRKLKNLYLNSNNIKTLSSPALFVNNPELKELNLGENLLQRFDFNILKTNGELQNLLMRRNELVELVNYEQTPQLLPKLRYIVFVDNFFNCSFYAKANDYFASRNASMEVTDDPTMVYRMWENEEPEKCIPDEDYGNELARRLNKFYNKSYITKESVDASIKALYELKTPMYRFKIIPKKFDDMLEDVRNCESGVEGYKLKLMDSCMDSIF